MIILKGSVQSIINNKKTAIIIVAFLVAIVIAFILLVILNGRGSEGKDIEYTDYEVSKVHMEQSLTAAGKVTAGKTETLSLPRGKTIKALGVVKNEAVTEGQPIVYYSDGTHTDAPADGIIEKINAPDNGEIVSDSDTIKFSRTDELYLKMTIPESQINNVARNDEAVIIINAKPNKRYRGEIVEKTDTSSDWLKKMKENSPNNSNDQESEDEALSPDDEEGGDSESAFFSVNIRFTNDGSIRPGMSASCAITVSSRDNIVAVPIEAVEFEKGKAFVYVAKGNGMEQRFVETGISDPINVEILKGLEAGDIIKIIKR